MKCPKANNDCHLVGSCQSNGRCPDEIVRADGSQCNTQPFGKCYQGLCTTVMPSMSTSMLPILMPSSTPSLGPTAYPSAIPSTVSNSIPSLRPTVTPYTVPSSTSSQGPSVNPSTALISIPSQYTNCYSVHHSIYCADEQQSISRTNSYSIEKILDSRVN